MGEGPRRNNLFTPRIVSSKETQQFVSVTFNVDVIREDSYQKL